MITRDVCRGCGGSGHEQSCSCRGFVAVVMGCCRGCGGEGFVSANHVARDHQGLVDARGRPLIIDDDEDGSPPAPPDLLE